VLLTLAATPARATPRDLDEAARAVATATLYGSAATIAAIQREADATINGLRARVEALQRQGASARAELVAAQERMVATLAQRDRAYAQEIAVFRSAVEDIAATPEGAAALARYNAGDEPGALAVLDQLRAARDRARQTRIDVESAAEARRIAALALDARNKGRVATAAVIARYEEVTRLDPALHWDWVELGRLYQDAGRLPDARRAAERAAATAGDDRDRGVALHELGVIQRAQGDLRAARQAFEQYLAIARRLAAADPSSASLQRDVSVSLNKVGDVLVAQGDLAGARTRYEE
jgi:tetratricopeptide (TPR) repeat protein